MSGDLLHLTKVTPELLLSRAAQAPAQTVVIRIGASFTGTTDHAIAIPMLQHLQPGCLHSELRAASRLPASSTASQRLSSAGSNGPALLIGCQTEMSESASSYMLIT